MMRIPLFGQDSEPLYTSRVMAAAGTAFLFLVFCLVVLIVPSGKQERKFETVRIVLSGQSGIQESASGEEFSPPVPVLNSASAEEFKEAPMPEPSEREQAQPESVPLLHAAETPEIEPPAERKSAPQKKRPETVNSLPEKKSAAVRNPETPAEKRVAEFVAHKSAEELMAEQFSARKKTVEFDDSLFEDADSSADTVTRPAPVPAVAGSSGISGTSAKSAEKNPVLSAASAAAVSSPGGNSAEAETVVALGAVSRAESHSFSGGQKRDSGGEFSGDDVDRLSMKWNGGGARKPIGTPSVSLSSESGKLIDNDVTAVIAITVLPGGNVLGTEIRFVSGGALIPDSVKDEIRRQISEWRFEPGEGISTAEFRLEIQKI